MTLDLDRIEAALPNGSMRPWKAESHSGRPGNHFLSSEQDGEYIGDMCRSYDADLAVLAVNSLPALVARIRELEAALGGYDHLRRSLELLYLKVFGSQVEPEEIPTAIADMLERAKVRS